MKSPSAHALQWGFSGLIAGVFLMGLPMGMAIQHKDKQIAALADFANQILDKTADAMELCVAQRDAARAAK